MRSFITYPLEFEKLLFPESTLASGKSIAHYQLYKKVRHLDGTIIKCGITAEEGYTRFAMFKSLMSPHSNQKMIAFEKDTSVVEYSGIKNNTPYANINLNAIVINNKEQNLIQKGINDEVHFVPGNVNSSIPDYLIENPELKIAFLNIDFDDYESTLSSLEYFYPRLVEGGILVLDNYYKNEEEYKAIQTYFCTSDMAIHKFSVVKGPHFIVKN